MPCSQASHLCMQHPFYRHLIRFQSLTRKVCYGPISSSSSPWLSQQSKLVCCCSGFLVFALIQFVFSFSLLFLLLFLRGLFSAILLHPDRWARGMYFGVALSIRETYILTPVKEMYRNVRVNSSSLRDLRHFRFVRSVTFGWKAFRCQWFFFLSWLLNRILLGYCVGALSHTIKWVPEIAKEKWREKGKKKSGWPHLIFPLFSLFLLLVYAFLLSCFTFYLPLCLADL